MFVRIGGLTLILKKIGERKAFVMRPKHQFIYPYEKNKFIVTNNGKKRDYYVNPCLSKLTDEH